MTRGLNGLLGAVITCRNQPHPLKIDRLHILLLVGTGAAERPSELCRQTNIDRTAMSKLLAELRGRGKGPALLETQADAKDDRYRRLVLTKEGEKLLGQIGGEL